MAAAKNKLDHVSLMQRSIYVGINATGPSKGLVLHWLSKVVPGFSSHSIVPYQSLFLRHKIVKD